MYKVY